MVHHQVQNSKSNYNYNAYVYFNRNYMPHFHSNYELIYVLDGSISVTVNGICERADKGDCVLVLSNQIHAISFIGHCIMWIGVFSQQFIPHFASKIKDMEGNTSVFRCESTTDEFIRQNLILSEGSTVMKKACFYAICDEYMRSVTLQKKNSKNNQLICQMLDYIENHYKENITLSELASHFGYEYHYLSRLLSNGYHISFSDTVNRYRVENAVTLLENTDKSITDIALESGFRSIRSFNHTFRSVMGISPSDMRNGAV